MRIQRERNTLRLGRRYSQFVMQLAFVVWLGPQTKPELGRFQGRVEEVETAEELRFQYTEELLTFLGKRFTEAVGRSMHKISAGHEPDQAG